MIFYFSGTGNSLQAAMKVQQENEQIIAIADCVKEKRFHFTLEEGETLGIVCPTYFYGIPTIVHYFLRQLELDGPRPEYSYGLLTCGGSIGGADRMLEEKLAITQEIFLNAAFSVKMPDNYVLMYDVASEEKQDQTLAEADAALDVIRKRIENRECCGIISNKLAVIQTNILYPFYERGRKTEKFWTDDRCVGCGMCAKRCPSGAIEMIDGKPTWVKERCIHCLQCTNRCGAIQYGKGTVKRGRYVNPVWRKKKHH